MRTPVRPFDSGRCSAGPSARLARLARAFDPFAASAALLFFPLLKVFSRSDKLPATRAMLDRAGVSVIRHHYYSPFVMPKDISRPLDEPRALPGLDLNIAGQLALVKQFHYQEELVAIPTEPTSRNNYAYHNRAFESGDGEMLYNMVRHFKPKRVIEIGCGQSTLMSLMAERRNSEEDLAYSCSHVCIEPFEQPWLEGTGAHIVRQRVESVDPAVFETLEANDILFIDSSHVIRPQGDVLHEYLHLLGIIRSGVLVHVHDVFTPRDYPASWVVGERRLWNEQYLLEAFLSFNRNFRVLAAVNHLFHDHADALKDACPVLLQEPFREPGSFWFQRCEGDRTVPQSNRTG
jgi:Methyltransferase domain